MVLAELHPAPTENRRPLYNHIYSSSNRVISNPQYFPRTSQLTNRKQNAQSASEGIQAIEDSPCVFPGR
jgi:tRNA1(Val) A37 N6-methylase TrmN6